MRKIFTDEFIRNALAMFDGIKNLKDVAGELGVHPSALSKAIRRNGFAIPLGKDSKERKQLPDELIARSYIAGLSELELSKEYGVDRIVIRRRLKEQGVEIRGPSAANIVSAARLSPEFRQKRAEAAHAAVRGKKRTHDELVRRSITKESIECYIGSGENELKQLLIAAGFDVIPQKTCDIYNIDLAVGNVAVELKSGVSTLGICHSDHTSGRIEKLIESGYSVLYVCFRDIEALVAAFDNIVSEINILSSLPTVRGQYRVIGCRLQDYAIVKNERQQFTRVPAPVQLHTTVRDFNL